MGGTINESTQMLIAKTVTSQSGNYPYVLLAGYKIITIIIAFSTLLPLVNGPYISFRKPSQLLRGIQPVLRVTALQVNH